MIYIQTNYPPLQLQLHLFIMKKILISFLESSYSTHELLKNPRDSGNFKFKSREREKNK